LEKDPARRPSSEAVVRLLSVACCRDSTAEHSDAGEPHFTNVPFVGREHELTKLMTDATRIRETGQGRTLFLLGEAGVGTTRLVQEFRIRAVLDGWRVIDVTSHAGKGIAYGCFREVLVKCGDPQIFHEIDMSSAQTAIVELDVFSRRDNGSEFCDSLTQ